MENLVIEPAVSPDGLARCLAIRDAVFTREKGVPKEIEVDGHDRLSDTCDHFLLCCAGNDVGAIRCLHTAPDTIRIQRFCFLRDCRGLGLGRAVMEHLESHYCALGVTQIVMDAKFEAAGFYEKCGYRRVSDIFTEAGIPHVKMEKTL